MKNTRKYYRTTFTLTVLHEEPDAVNELSELAEIATFIDTGDGVGDLQQDGVTETLNGKEAADALVELGSDPSFFNLDEKGEEAGW